jgi:hypothetical protein
LADFDFQMVAPKTWHSAQVPNKKGSGSHVLQRNHTFMDKSALGGAPVGRISLDSENPHFVVDQSILIDRRECNIDSVFSKLWASSAAKVWELPNWDNT